MTVTTVHAIGPFVENQSILGRSGATTNIVFPISISVVMAKCDHPAKRLARRTCEPPSRSVSAFVR